MSVQAMTWAFGQPISDSAAKVILLVLANRADHKTRECWPSIETIAEESSRSPRTVVRKVRWLESVGLIEKVKIKDSAGRQVSNHYILRLDLQYSGDGLSDEEEAENEPTANLSLVNRRIPGATATPGPVPLVSPDIEAEPTEEPRTPIAPKGAEGASQGDGEGQETGAAFAAFLAAWPPSRTFSRHTAARQWRRLALPDRSRATGAVKPYLAACREQTRKPVDPSTFLARRLFENFDAKPVEPPKIDPRHDELRRAINGHVDDSWVWVECGTADMNAWVRACQEANLSFGVGPPIFIFQAPGRGRGRMFPTRLPPGADEQLLQRSDAA